MDTAPELLDAAHDPASRRRLELTGLDSGWRCLEIGAGSGSIARWLEGRIGDRGTVEVRSADVLAFEPELRPFDLIHARAVLPHDAGWKNAIERMVSWLAPGGWLVVEEMDWLAQTTTDASWNAVLGAYARATPTTNPACRRELVPELAKAGLEAIDADASVDTVVGGTPMADWYALGIRGLRDSLLAEGTATEADIDRQLERLQDPDFRALGMAWVGAWGRK